MNFLTAVLAIILGIAAGTGAGFLLSKTLEKLRARGLSQKHPEGGPDFGRAHKEKAHRGEEIFKLRQRSKKRQERRSGSSRGLKGAWSKRKKT